jgi:TonB family protein
MGTVPVARVARHGYRQVTASLIYGETSMTNLKRAIAALSLMLVFGASTQAARAQSLPGSNVTCPLPNADARPITNYAADWPSTMPWILHQYLRGAALVQFEVAADGTPQNATIVKSTGFYQLDDAARQLVLSQSYAPANRDCMPVSGHYLYEVDY